MVAGEKVERMVMEEIIKNKSVRLIGGGADGKTITISTMAKFLTFPVLPEFFGEYFGKESPKIPV